MALLMFVCGAVVVLRLIRECVKVLNGLEPGPGWWHHLGVPFEIIEFPYDMIYDGAESCVAFSCIEINE
jgi:hypothetical protein